MTLTDQQIERYSRQIIVPDIGGLGQERLLASSAAIVGEHQDVTGALAYLSGAGVGRIVVDPVGYADPYRLMAARAGETNPDVSISIAGDDSAGACDLLLAIIGDAPAVDVAMRVCCERYAKAMTAGRERSSRAAVIARLDTPSRIAILPAPPPCPLCADTELFAGEVGARADLAGVVAMIAVSEALGLLAGIAGKQPQAAIIEFDGYASRRMGVGRRESAGQPPCACETTS